MAALLLDKAQLLLQHFIGWSHLQFIKSYLSLQNI